LIVSLFQYLRGGQYAIVPNNVGYEKVRRAVAVAYYKQFAIVYDIGLVDIY
jgi:hypothetical protein